jgi:hypothetical protein
MAVRDREDPHDLVAVVVDHLDGDLPRRWHREWTRGGGLDRRPGILGDVGTEGPAKLLVGIARAEEVGVADEEALAVVGRVEELARDVVGGRGADLAVVGS